MDKREGAGYFLGVLEEAVGEVVGCNKQLFVLQPSSMKISILIELYNVLLYVCEKLSIRKEYVQIKICI